ncbi:MAG: peptidoglycan/LPS O-acetylase OafA/YrhL [Oleiphilaceae bacterium]|jgi:peptidoglycan/LPS O-acetylase OafA/YrhL
MKKLGVINGLRGIAILAVIYHHVFSWKTGPGFAAIDMGNATLLPFTLLANGWLGVNLFFILSGFVLFYPYALQQKQFDSLACVKTFYWRRATRLLPLYYFSLLICIIFIVKPLSIASLGEDAFYLLTVTFNFTNDLWAPRYNWVLWSLGIEVWFSILFPLLIVCIKKYGVIQVLIAVLIISLATRIIGNDPQYYTVNPYLNPIKDSLLGRLDEFLWGMFVCYFYVNHLHKITKKWSVILFTLGILLVFVASLSWDYVILKMLPPSFIPFINIILDAGFVMLTISLLAMRENVIKWLFSNYLIQLFGVMCYSLYIWHGVAIPNIISAYDFLHLAMYFSLVFILSCFSYRYIEFGYKKDIKALFLLKPTVKKENL